VEKALNRKMRPHYVGPLIIVARNFGGAYILCELDGSVLHRPITAFRVIPYFARKSLPLPENFMDIDYKRLDELQKTTNIDGEEIADEETSQEIIDDEDELISDM
jgi:hypothetical protein